MGLSSTRPKNNARLVSKIAVNFSLVGAVATNARLQMPTSCENRLLTSPGPLLAIEKAEKEEKKTMKI